MPLETLVKLGQAREVEPKCMRRQGKLRLARQGGDPHANRGGQAPRHERITLLRASRPDMPRRTQSRGRTKGAQTASGPKLAALRAMHTTWPPG